MAATVSVARLLALPESLQAEIVSRVPRRVLQHLLLAASIVSHLALMWLTYIDSASLLRCPVHLLQDLPLPSVKRLDVKSFSDALGELLTRNHAFVERLKHVNIGSKAIVDGSVISKLRSVPSFNIIQKRHPGVIDMLGEMSGFSSLRHLKLDVGEPLTRAAADSDTGLQVGIAAAVTHVSMKSCLTSLCIIWRPTTVVTIPVSEFTQIRRLNVSVTGSLGLHWQDLLVQCQLLTRLVDLVLCVDRPLLRASSPQQDGVTGLTCLIRGNDMGSEEFNVLSTAFPRVRDLLLDHDALLGGLSAYDFFSAWGRHCTVIESLKLDWIDGDMIDFCAALHAHFGGLTTLTIQDTFFRNPGDLQTVLCFLAPKLNLRLVKFFFRNRSEYIEGVVDTAMELFRRPMLFVFKSGSIRNAGWENPGYEEDEDTDEDDDDL